MTKRIGTTVVTSLLMATAMGAMAGEPRGGELVTISETVRFDDLDLDKPAAVATLHWRLRMAANKVCLSAPRYPYACRRQAFERALPQVPAVVSDYHAEWVANGAQWSAEPRSSVSKRLASSR